MEKLIFSCEFPADSSEAERLTDWLITNRVRRVVTSSSFKKGVIFTSYFIECTNKMQLKKLLNLFA